MFRDHKQIVSCFHRPVGFPSLEIAEKYAEEAEGNRPNYSNYVITIPISTQVFCNLNCLTLL